MAAPAGPDAGEDGRRPHRVDVHAHLPIDVRATPDDRHPAQLPWSTADAVERLDRLGIRHQVFSMPGLPTSPGPDGRPAIEVARSMNDTFARIIDEAPDRFSAFATVPGDDPDAAVAEAERALQLPGFRGLGLCSNVEGRYLGDPWFEGLFGLAESRGIPVFVHPALNLLAAPLALGRPPFLVEFPLDTFRSIVDAVYAGVFERHPGLRLIVAHCGGALPALAWRVASLAHLVGPGAGGLGEEKIGRALRGLYLDTALSGAPEVLRSAAGLVGAPPPALRHRLRSGRRRTDRDQHRRIGPRGFHRSGTRRDRVRQRGRTARPRLAAAVGRQGAPGLKVVASPRHT